MPLEVELGADRPYAPTRQAFLAALVSELTALHAAKSAPVSPRWPDLKLQHLRPVLTLALHENSILLEDDFFLEKSLLLAKLLLLLLNHAALLVN